MESTLGSTLDISLNDTIAEDSGEYICQVSVTIFDRDIIRYNSSNSTVMLTGNDASVCINRALKFKH